MGTNDRSHKESQNHLFRGSGCIDMLCGCIRANPCKKGIKTRASRRFFQSTGMVVLPIYFPSVNPSGAPHASAQISVFSCQGTRRGSVETAGLISYCVSSALIYHLPGGNVWLFMHFHCFVGLYVLQWYLIVLFVIFVIASKPWIIVYTFIVELKKLM